MTIDQVIALSASVGAFMSAIAAFLAVRQNTKQREASYRPELAITKTTLTASKSPISKSTYADFWIEKKDEGDSAVGNLLSSLTLPLRNVGFSKAQKFSRTP